MIREYKYKECTHTNRHSTSIAKQSKQELATVPQTFALTILASLSMLDDPSARPAELTGIGCRSGIGCCSGIAFGSRWSAGARLPSRGRLSSPLLILLFCLFHMSHTRNGTRTRVVPALTATGITILGRSAVQRHKENSLVFFLFTCNGSWAGGINKSCNLIGSWSGGNFLIRTATADGIHRVDLFS